MAARPWRRSTSPRPSRGAASPNGPDAPRRPAAEPIDVALRYLAARPRSEAEIRRRLARAGCEGAAADAVLARLRQTQLVDDSAFADYWVDQRRTFRPRGARLVAAELRQHGIAAPIAQAATADLAESAVEDALRALGRRVDRELAVQPIDWSRVDARLSGCLARRGFDWSTIAAVLRRIRAEHAPDAD